MKEAECRLNGVKLTDKAPEGGSTSGRLIPNVHYRIIGYGDVAATDKFRSWKGVLVERLDTLTQVVIGTNTMLGTAIRFVGIGTEGASEKGYVAQTLPNHPFTSVNDFAPRKIGGKLYDNGTVFVVSGITPLQVNKNYNPDLDKANPTTDDLALKQKDFYEMEIVVTEKETAE